MRGGEGGRVGGEETRHGFGLVVRQGEDVGEAPTRENDGFAGGLGLGDGCARRDLRGAYARHVRAAAREGRVEGAPRGGLGSAGAGGGGAAEAAVAGDAVVARGVEDGDSREAEFEVFGALAGLVGGGEVGFVVAVGGADDGGGGEGAAVLGGVAAGEGVGVLGVSV